MGDGTGFPRVAEGHEWVETGSPRVAGGHEWVETGSPRVAGGHEWVGTGSPRVAEGHERVENRVWDVLPFVPLAPRARQYYSYRERPDVPLAPGMLVQVPFGSREVTGLTWKRSRRVPRRRLKPTTKVLSRSPLFAPQELLALERLGEVSLEPLTLIAKAASRVREPLKNNRPENRVPASGPEGLGVGGNRKTHTTGHAQTQTPAPEARHPDVQWKPLREVLPASIAGQLLVLVPETVLGREVLQILEERKIPATFFAQALPLRARRAATERLARREPLAVVATHAGVFLPFPTLSRVIVVEAALPSHRQWDRHPRYDARVAALLLARARGVPLTLQSTLPSLDLYVLDHAVLPALYRSHHPSSALSLLPRLPSDPLLSPGVLASVKETLASDGSALLFHDVAGRERIFTCDTCGFTLRCEACGNILERAGSSLRCSRCGTLSGRVPPFCPQCRSPHIGPRRVGTATIHEQLRRAFPSVTVLRADRETLFRTRPGFSPSFSVPPQSIVIATERAFAVFSDALFDRVIIVSADRVLEDTAFDAAERFALLVTRLGWYAKPGAKLFLQTGHPHLAVVQALAEEKMPEWMAEEARERRQLGYPPHTPLLHLERLFSTPTKALGAVQTLASKCSKHDVESRVGYRVSGIARRTRAEVVLRSSLAKLGTALDHLPADWSTDPLIPLSVLVRRSS